MKGLLRVLRAPAVRAHRAWSRRRQPHGIILAYHRVAEPVIDPWQLCVSPGHFAQHLQEIATFADFVPLRDFTNQLADPRTKRPIVAITFDDGYADNLYAALPILQRLGAPATIFLSTGWIGEPKGFWWDRLTHTVFKPARLPEELSLDVLDYRWRAGNSLQHQRERLHMDLWQRLQNLDSELRDDILERLAAWAGTTSTGGDERPMTADEVASLASSPAIEIGAHSVNHRSLPALSEAEQIDELSRSAQDCESLTGSRPESFAYPFGNHTAATPALLVQAGFKRACSLLPDLVWKNSDPLRLPRIGAVNRDGRHFARRLRREWLP